MGRLNRALPARSAAGFLRPVEQVDDAGRKRRCPGGVRGRLSDILATPGETGCHTLSHGQFAQLTRLLRATELHFARRELELTEEAKRLSMCRQRVMSDEAAAKKRIHLLSATLAENRRALAEAQADANWAGARGAPSMIPCARA